MHTNCHNCCCCGDSDNSFDLFDGWIAAAAALQSFETIDDTAQAVFHCSTSESIGGEAFSGEVQLTVTGPVASVADFVATGALRPEVSKLISRQTVQFNDVDVDIVVAEGARGVFAESTALLTALPDGTGARRFEIALNPGDGALVTCEVGVTLISAEGLGAQAGLPVALQNRAGRTAMAYVANSTAAAESVNGGEIDSWVASGGTLAIDVTTPGFSATCSPGGPIPANYLSSTTGTYCKLGVTSATVRKYDPNSSTVRVRYLMKTL